MKFGVSSSRQSLDSKCYINLKFCIVISKYRPIHSERKHLPHQIRVSKTRRSQRFQSRKKWTSLYTNRHALLRQPLSLEGLTLRFQVRYMVSRLRPIRNDHFRSSLQSRRYGRSVQSRYFRSVPANKLQIFKRISTHYQINASAKT